MNNIMFIFFCRRLHNPIFLAGDESRQVRIEHNNKSENVIFRSEPQLKKG